MHNNVGNSYRLEGDLNKAREHLETAREMMSNIFADEKTESRAKVSQSSYWLQCSQLACCKNRSLGGST